MVRAMVTDDEGKRLPLVWFNPGMGLFSLGPLPREIQKAMRTVVKNEMLTPAVYFSRRMLVWMAIMFVVFVPGMAYVSSQMPWMYSHLGRPWNSFVPLIPMINMVLVLLAVHLFGPLSWPESVCRAAAETAVFAGRCGSCGYSISDQPRTPEGVCRCPECGAAWRRG